ncbi:MAG: hypothetical protein V1891_03095 [bacterium]
MIKKDKKSDILESIRKACGNFLIPIREYEITTIRLKEGIIIFSVGLFGKSWFGIIKNKEIKVIETEKKMDIKFLESKGRFSKVEMNGELYLINMKKNIVFPYQKSFGFKIYCVLIFLFNIICQVKNRLYSVCAGR